MGFFYTLGDFCSFSPPLLRDLCAVSMPNNINKKITGKNLGYVQKHGHKQEIDRAFFNINDIFITLYPDFIFNIYI